MTLPKTDLTVRAYEPTDERAVLELLHASLSHTPDDEYAAYVHWKHRENPFGESFGWVATSSGRVVGLRLFMRWEFERDGMMLRAVRAVDTATAPEFQGLGIFRTLTMHGLDAIRDAGIDFVFNTPNDKSRPGYLKMGWCDVGRLPVLIRPRSPFVLGRMAHARVPSEMWSLPCSAGDGAPDVFSGAGPELGSALDARAPSPFLRTRRTAEFMQWRYGLASLSYRVLRAGASLEDGFVVFRKRRRGPATEAVVADVIVPGDHAPTIRRLLRSVATASQADYVVRLANGPGRRGGAVPLPGQGPRLTWRSVNQTDMPDLRSWQLVLGDVELF